MANQREGLQTLLYGIRQLAQGIYSVRRGIQSSKDKKAAHKALADLLGDDEKANTLLDAMKPGQALSYALRQHLAENAANAKASASAEHERQVGERQTTLETMRETSREKGATERAKAASDLETQRQAGREKLAGMKAKTAKVETLSDSDQKRIADAQMIGKDLSALQGKYPEIGKFLKSAKALETGGADVNSYQTAAQIVMSKLRQRRAELAGKMAGLAPDATPEERGEAASLDRVLKNERTITEYPVLAQKQARVHGNAQAPGSPSSSETPSPGTAPGQAGSAPASTFQPGPAQDGQGDDIDTVLSDALSSGATPESLLAHLRTLGPKELQTMGLSTGEAAEMVRRLDKMRSQNLSPDQQAQATEVQGMPRTATGQVMEMGVNVGNQVGNFLTNAAEHIPGVTGVGNPSLAQSLGLGQRKDVDPADAAAQGELLAQYLPKFLAEQAGFGSLYDETPAQTFPQPAAAAPAGPGMDLSGLFGMAPGPIRQNRPMLTARSRFPSALEPGPQDQLAQLAQLLQALQ